MTLPTSYNTPRITKPPLKFPTPALLAEAIDHYFKYVTREEITQSGLCLHIKLGKDSLNRYLLKEGYEDIVMMAKLKIENAYETSLREKGGAANIFALKNFGWKDTQEHQHSGNGDNPIVAKIVREIVTVNQIEHEPAVDISEIVDDSTSAVAPALDFTPDSAPNPGVNRMIIERPKPKTVKDDLSEDFGLPSTLDDLADEYDDFLQ